MRQNPSIPTNHFHEVMKTVHLFIILHSVHSTTNASPFLASIKKRQPRSQIVVSSLYLSSFLIEIRLIAFFKATSARRISIVRIFHPRFSPLFGFLCTAQIDFLFGLDRIGQIVARSFSKYNKPPAIAYSLRPSFSSVIIRGDGQRRNQRYMVGQDPQLTDGADHIQDGGIHFFASPSGVTTRQWIIRYCPS